MEYPEECSIHGIKEFGTIMCIECGHIFKDHRELVDEFNKVIMDIVCTQVHEHDEIWCSPVVELVPYEKWVEKIGFCPICGHDF